MIKRIENLDSLVTTTLQASGLAGCCGRYDPARTTGRVPAA